MIATMLSVKKNYSNEIIFNEVSINRYVEVSYVDYACGWNRKIMKFLGIWPEEKNFNRASSYRVLMPIGLMFLFITIPQTTNLYFIWGDFDLIVENLSVANMTITIAMLKTAAFWYNGRSMKTLLTYMEEDRKKADTEENVTRMTKIANITRKLTVGSTLMCNSVVILYVTLRTLLLPYTGRVVYYPAYFPYNTKSFPNFELTVLGQVAGAFCAANSYTAVDTFMTMLVLHVCGQFSDLRQQLSKLCSNGNCDFRAKLSEIVEKYDILTRYAGTIEDRFNGMLLVQMVGCTVQLCVQSFQAISALVDEEQGFLLVQLLFLAVYTSYVMLHIYLYCFIGQKLFAETTGIAYAVYECEWYNLSPNEARSLILIMCRTRKPSRITAGKFCSFNHELFSDILKKSMGYLSVLYAMKAKNVE